MSEELFIVGRFHAAPGNEKALEEAIRTNMRPARAEPGCLHVNGFRSLRDPRLFLIVSGWKDVEALELHATLPHTVRLLETVEPLIDHPFDINRVEKIC